MKMSVNSSNERSEDLNVRLKCICILRRGGKKIIPLLFFAVSLSWKNQTWFSLEIAVLEHLPWRLLSLSVETCEGNQSSLIPGPQGRGSGAHILI